MGLSCSCSFPISCDLENGIESVIVNSINLDNNDIKLRSTNTQNMCKHMVTPFSRLSSSISPHSSIFEPNSPKHEAAIKLQKVYKSFRTRRKLADCAVLIEQSWWKLLDFAELKHSSISFFEIDKHETAVSRWSRARTRAAKVGKGLSKNGKARKLALQHWLEAIDPRHRYGHNLHFYYVKWLNSQSKEPFFYWLDIGEGKEVNLIEKCPRSKLHQQCIKYLGPMERKAYEVAMEDGKLFYKQTGEFLETTNDPKGCKWIFVLSTSKILYVAKKKKGSFQHSSFLAGGATLAAGRIVAENGVLKAVWPHSGHYKPTPENFQDLLAFLRENNVDLTDVKLDPTDEDEEESIAKKLYLRCNSSGDEFADKVPLETGSDNGSENSMSINVNPREKDECSRKPTSIEIPSKEGLLEELMSEDQIVSHFLLPSPMDGYERAKESFASKDDERKEETILEDSILKRINSHKAMKSFQLGKQLSSKWSTGAGPRIGCLRDYPSGLQCRALEQVDLTPGSICRFRLECTSRSSTPTSSDNLSRSSSSSSINSSDHSIMNYT